MIRKFKFEAEIYESLNCLPMVARRKLDAVGIKLHLAQWERLGRGERLMICHAPADSEEERSALRIFIEEVAMARTGSPAKILPDDARRSASPPDHPPPLLTQHARELGIELDDKAWAALDDDQRYALIKLGDAERPSHNLELALQEFFDSGARAKASSKSGLFGKPGEKYMSRLRIFSYLPNPRIWKATIVARLCGLDLELRGAALGIRGPRGKSSQAGVPGAERVTNIEASQRPLRLSMVTAIGRVPMNASGLEPCFMVPHNHAQRHRTLLGG